VNMTSQANLQATPKVFIVCDQSDTAPIWGYIIREKGLIAVLETSVDKATRRSVEVNPDLIVIDINVPHLERIELCKKIREVTGSPILIFLPANHETEILEAYQSGVDECVIKPISPAIFLAKILAWARRGQTLPAPGEKPFKASNLRLDPTRRLAVGPEGHEVKLTNLEFRLLRLLLSRPEHIFTAEEIVQSVWGVQGESDQALLKNVVYRLRKKLEEESGGMQVIRTWPGGYSFQED
jgi:DNA-binding response OmpR family regulator